MEKEIHLIEYRNGKFFQKIKNNVSNINKNNFFDLYEKAKKQEIDIQNLDIKTIRKILLIAIEELNINSEKIDERLKTLEIGLNNAKMYNKEIEVIQTYQN